MVDGTKKLLHDHDQIALAFSRERFGYPDPCAECGDELKVSWQYCPRCGQPIEQKN